ncbi:MAG: hypothetical protein ABIP75_01250 [Pyrinomonadaceae bacterium]
MSVKIESSRDTRVALGRLTVEVGLAVETIDAKYDDRQIRVWLRRADARVLVPVELCRRIRAALRHV